MIVREFAMDLDACQLTRVFQWVDKKEFSKNLPATIDWLMHCFRLAFKVAWRTMSLWISRRCEETIALVVKYHSKLLSSGIVKDPYRKPKYMQPHSSYLYFSQAINNIYNLSQPLISIQRRLLLSKLHQPVTPFPLAPLPRPHPSYKQLMTCILFNRTPDWLVSTDSTSNPSTTIHDQFHLGDFNLDTATCPIRSSQRYHSQ